nr:anti-sigma factor [Dietzia maris]
MSIRHHDHPSDLGSVRPEDLDLYALDALDDDEAAAVEMALVSASAEEKSSMLAHIASTREVVAGIVADAGLDTAPPPQLRDRVLELAAAATPRGPAR